MRGIWRRALFALLALMLLAGQIQPASAGLVKRSGSGQETLLQSALIQEDPDVTVNEEVSEEQTEEDARQEESGKTDDRESVEEEWAEPALDEDPVSGEDISGAADSEAGNTGRDTKEAVDSGAGNTGRDTKGAGDSRAESKGEDAAGKTEAEAVSGDAVEEDSGSKDCVSDSAPAGDQGSEDSIMEPAQDADEGSEKAEKDPSSGGDEKEETSEQILTARLIDACGEDRGPASDACDASDALVSSDPSEEEDFSRAQFSASDGSADIDPEKGAQEEPVITLSGQMPVGAQVLAREAQAQAEEAGLFDVLCAYDITINDGWQPKKALEVSIALKGLPENVLVYHIDEDGKPEEIKVTRSETGEVVFPAEGFSIYAVTEAVYRRTYEFMQYVLGDYMPYEFTMTLPEDPEDPNHGIITANRQILRNGDSLIVPSLPNQHGMRFLGWYTSPTADIDRLIPERGGVKNDIKSNSIVTLYARYGWPVTITFYSRPEGSDSNQVFNTLTVYLPGEKQPVAVDLTQQISPEAPAAGQSFIGWKQQGSSQILDSRNYTVGENGDVVLYPCFENRCKIVFSREDDKEEYVAPVWVGENGMSGKLTDHVPVREGYAFSGWAAGDVRITDSESILLTEEITFSGGTLTGGVLRLDRDITLHSLWTSQQTQYRVLFWQEKTSDIKKLICVDGTWSVPGNQREYDFTGTLRINAEAGEIITREYLEEKYGGLAGNDAYMLDEGPADFTGFVFDYVGEPSGARLESAYTVEGDGTGFVHIFYRREVVTLHFDYPDDVSSLTAVSEPDYYPALPASGTVTQNAVTAVSHADYPDDLVLVGLYGGQISDGVTEEGEPAQWPVFYTAQNLSYTATTRIMKYTGGQWKQNSASSAEVSEDSRTFATMWSREDGQIVKYQETFGNSAVLHPLHILDNLRLSGSDSAISFYRENEQAAYPASAVYASTPALTYSASAGETITVECPFEGFELDFFTYSDSRGTPIRRESNASEDERTLTGGGFSNLKIYCKRRVHHVIFHNGSDGVVEGPGVKYGMSLATDYVRQFIEAPGMPSEYAGKEDEVEFSGWYLDEERTTYLDFVGLKAAERDRLMMQYDQIQGIYSVYDYRQQGGASMPAVRMGDSDLHLYAGWTVRRILVELDPDGGELPSNIPTYFWKNYGETLSVYSVSRNYIPAGEEDEGEKFIYHIHTYEQSQKDNDTSDRTACYLPASDEDEGVRYICQPDSYRFLGWFLVEEGVGGKEVLKPYDHESHLTKDIKLRAQWSRPGIYRVVYEKGEHGTLTGEVSSATYRDHASIALNGAVTPDQGYVFTGWKIRRPGTTDEFFDTLYSSGDELVLNADQAQITLDEYAGVLRGVITLVAQYAPMRATSITYYVNGGSYSGYTQEDLDLDPSLDQVVRDMLVSDYGAKAAHHYIYDAKGTVIGYTISGIEQNANLRTESGTVFSRSGYKLMGWSYTPDGSVDLPLNMGGFYAATDPDGRGYVLYAVWKPEIRVTYNLQGGTWNTASGSEYRQEGDNWVCGVGSGEQIPVPRAPSKEGYTFAGWHSSSTAKSGLQVMPKITRNYTLYAVWTTNTVLKFDVSGGEWETLTKGFILLEGSYYGVSVTPGGSYTLPTVSPVREGGYIFYKWEQGSYKYSPGESFKTSAEQSGMTITLTAVWFEGVPAVNVLVGADDSVTIEDSENMVGAAEDSSGPADPGEIEGYQFLFTVYDVEPAEKEDIAEHYRVTSIRNLGENTYQVTLANGQTKIHYPDSVEKLQAVYIQDRPVDVCLKRMNVFEDGMDNMNLTLTSISEDPYTTLEVGKVDIQKALPKPNDYSKAASGTTYKSYTYAIGRKDADSMFSIDTMTQQKLWIRQTLNGFAFSVNGQEWKDLDREDGSGKDAAVYIIYDNRVETPTTINHVVYGLKSDKEKLFTYQVFVKGRWGFNIGSAAYFLNKPDDPSEELNSYTVALHDKENVLIPLHIDYLTGQRQNYVPGDLFYDMFGNDNPTTITNRSELRIWQEVEMRRMSELPFTGGTFETSIQMRSISGTLHNSFNGFDTENHLWLKQLGISKFYTNKFSHSFIYTRTSLDVPVHVLEVTRDGYALRDEWLKDGSQTLSVTADAFTVDEAKASELVPNTPEEYALQSVRYGLSSDDLHGEDKELVLRLAAEKNDATLFHLYDYESADSETRSLITDGSEIFLVYYRHSSAEIPVEYVKKDSSGAYVPVDLEGYGLKEPTITITASEATDFREDNEIREVNSGVRKLDAIYLTGRMFLSDQRDNVLATYDPGSYGDWDTGQALELQNSEAGVIYQVPDRRAAQRVGTNVRVWVEVANNIPLKVMGRLWQRGNLETNTGIMPFLPKDEDGNIIATGNIDSGTDIHLIEENFLAFQKNISKIINGIDPDAEFIDAGIGRNEEIYSVAYCTDEDGYRQWYYQAEEGGAARVVTQVVYADYESSFSPVDVRYVVPTGTGGYREAEDLEEEIQKDLTETIKVGQGDNSVRLKEALDASLKAINERSTLYRTEGSLALGPSDLSQAYVVFGQDIDEITLSDKSTEGLTYVTMESGASRTETFDSDHYPDIYVVLRSIATLTVTKIIDDENGYAHWDDAFQITISLTGSDDVGIDGDYQASLTYNEKLNHAIPVAPEDSSTVVTFSGGEAQVTLQHGQSIAVPGLPRGITVTVTEQMTDWEAGIYRASYRIIEGAKVTKGNSFRLNRNAAVEVTNTSVDITRTGKDFTDSPAYALIICGGLVYAAYLLLLRRKRDRLADSCHR